MRNIYLIILSLSIVLMGRDAGAQTVADSLERRLQNVEGPARFETLSLLVEAFSETDPQRAIAYAAQARGLQNGTEGLQHPGLYFGLANAYLSLGMHDSLFAYTEMLAQHVPVSEGQEVNAEVLVLRGDYDRVGGRLDEALTNYERALEIYDAQENTGKQGDVLKKIGRVYYRSGALESALDAYAAAIEHYERVSNKVGVGKTFFNAGLVYDIMGEFEEALNLYEHALDIQEAHNDYVGAGITLCNIGIFYDLIGEVERAIAFHEQALVLCQETNQQLCRANALTNLAAIELNQKNYRAAIGQFEEALAIYRGIGYKLEQATTLNNLGLSYHLIRDVIRALSSYAEARALFKELGQLEGLAGVELDAGQLYRRQAHYDEALESLSSGLKIAEDVGSDVLKKKGYRELYLLHEGFGEYKEALAAHVKFKAANDSLFNQESQAILAELQTQFKTQEQQIRIQGLEKEREGQQRLMLLLFSGLLLLMALALVAYRLYRQKSLAHGNLTAVYQDLQDTQQQLIHSEKMASLGQLTAGVAHEIRNPLNFIINFSQLNVELSEELVTEIEQEGESKVGEVAHKFETIIKDLSFNAKKVNEHSHRADGIVQSMLEHANATRQERIPTDINEFVDEIVELAFYGVNQTKQACKIDVARNFDKTAGTYDLAPQELGRVLVNLIDNAIYAVCEKKAVGNGAYQPRIAVETESTKDKVIIRLQDNGPGMPAEVTQKIFEPFYSTKPTGKGTGLGLSLAYDIVTMSYGGEMVVDSAVGEGTKFEIALPKD